MPLRPQFGEITAENTPRRVQGEALRARLA